MSSSIESADVIAHDYRRDANRIARHVVDHERLPGSLASYEITNAFRFALGRVPQSIRDLYSLGEMASYSDLGRAVERKLNPPKQELEEIRIGEFPPTVKELRRAAALRKAGVDLIGGSEVSRAPAIRKTDIDATPANDWRAAVSGERG